MNSLTGKTAIVTGASEGIGAAVAFGLAAAGANVTLDYASDKDGACRAATRIRDAGGKAITVQGNVSKAPACCFAETIETFGAPSILVNNAGLFSFDALADIAEAEFHRQFDTNVLGVLLTSQAALKHFPEGGGSIVNISSIASFSAMPKSSVYSATKAAVDQITRALAKELGSRNIRVSAVAPGQTSTEGLRASGLGRRRDGTVRCRQHTAGPHRHTGRTAPAIVFLASDAARWITGERLAVCSAPAPRLHCQTNPQRKQSYPNSTEKSPSSPAAPAGSA